MIRTVTCTIRVDEELLDCDFSHPAASIEEAVHAWEGLKVVRWDDPAPIDRAEQLLQAIADALWGEGADSEWSSDTIQSIADAIQAERPDLPAARI